VFYANYLKYMERARTEYMRCLGFHKPALFDGLQFVVHEVAVKYHSPAVLDDLIDVTAVLIKGSRVSFEMSQQIYRGDELLVEGLVKVACINAQTKRPQGMPKEMITTLKSQIG
jgi:tol-pal system-associated acyl-CoA thioesterase